MNGDGYKDLIIGGYDGYINMYTRKADGTLNSATRLSTKNGAIKNKANWEKGIYPAITDWNNDGLKDMVVAFHHYNKSNDIKKCVTLFLNIGSKTNPVFEDKGNVTADGKEINFYWFQCPQVIDLNGDGKKDLILGHSGWEGTEANGIGYLWFFENNGTDAAPMLKAGVKLKLTNGTAIQDAGEKNLNNVCITHWDNDGALDMLIVHQNRSAPGTRGEAIRPTIRVLKGNGTTFISKSNIVYLNGMPEFSIVSKNTAVIKNFTGMGLAIFALSGTRVASYTNEMINAELVNKDLARFVPGTYLYRFESNASTNYSGDFIITH